MEPEVRAYLVRILNSISYTVVWLISNTTAGIQFGYAFIEQKITAGNIIFYLWLLISTVIFIWLMIRLWKKPLNIPE
ncbi:MAG TPA: hypothetical protein VHP12_09345 [Chitinophagaceae bacterium]|nr:hypothetical protein [Chitinophagaceae bacterium]